MQPILIAPDKFKGTLSASQAARAMEQGVRRYLAHAGEPAKVEIIIRPLADGGEGSHHALASLRPDYGVQHHELPDPAGRILQTASLADPAGNRYLETALNIGLLLPGARDRSILDRSTTGPGVWLREYISRPIDLRLFLGGSATSDGGFGLARALGIRFVRARGDEVTDFRMVPEAVRVEFPPLPTRARIILHTDVAAPLTGPHGAARLFAAQKGAHADEIAAIEERLGHMHALLREASGGPVEEPPGSGAAGGLGLPLLYWPGLDVHIESGIEFFLREAGLKQLFRETPPQLVLTGEGMTDRSTLSGKVVEGVRRLCETIPCLVFSGVVRDRAELEEQGYAHLYGTDEFNGPFEALKTADQMTVASEALTREAARRLEETVFRGLAGRQTGHRH